MWQFADGVFDVLSVIKATFIVVLASFLVALAVAELVQAISMAILRRRNNGVVPDAEKSALTTRMSRFQWVLFALLFFGSLAFLLLSPIA